jgi:hypothetical protein
VLVLPVKTTVLKSCRERKVRLRAKKDCTAPNNIIIIALVCSIVISSLVSAHTNN